MRAVPVVIRSKPRIRAKTNAPDPAFPLVRGLASRGGGI
jgi:hypothetical protein